QITIDCDVIEADGGTRTASITGAYVALHYAVQSLLRAGLIRQNPIVGHVAAISCGIYNGIPVLDLDYDEDSTATMDANFILTGDSRIIEIQCTAEENPVTEEQYNALFALAKLGVAELSAAQKIAMGG